MSVDYALVLTYHPDYVGRLWGMTDNDYATLVMADDGPKPTKAALESRYDAVALEIETKQIEAARRLRYQAETDGLYFDAMRGDGNLDAWNAATAQIRADLPYPETPDA
jgi:hypothetical protein